MNCLTAFVTPRTKINIYIIYKEYNSENILQGLIFRFGKLIHHRSTPRQTLRATNDPEDVKEVSAHAEGNNGGKQCKTETTVRYGSHLSS